MVEPILVLKRDTALVALTRGRVQAEPLATVDEVSRAFNRYRRALWLSLDSAALAEVATAVRFRATLHSLLVLRALPPAPRELLRALFRHVVAPGDGVRLLPPEELLDVLTLDHSEDAFVGGVVDLADESLLLFRGNLQPVVIALSWFAARPGGAEPNPRDLEIIDGGQTVRLGEYEAAADAILYELDADYRKRAKARELAHDYSFGAALRRLRLQRGLKRTDFPGLSDKEIARIERGEVRQPHSGTLWILAKRLGVAPEEIETY